MKINIDKYNMVAEIIGDDDKIDLKDFEIYTDSNGLLIARLDMMSDKVDIS